MCRIMCYITRKGHKARQQVILHALKNSDSNGGHSVGLLSIDDKGRATTSKLITDGEDAAIQLANQLPQGRVLLIHNRWATHGAKNERNAHPISKNGVHVIHNGVISNYATIKTNGEKVSETDTECIIDHYLNTGRDPKTFAQHVRELYGSKNFVIYDEKKRVLIFYKDSALDFAHSPTSGDVFVTSDYKQLIGKHDNRLVLCTYHGHRTIFGDYQTKRVVVDEEYTHDFVKLQPEHDYFVVDVVKMKTTYSTNAPTAPTTTTTGYNPYHDYSTEVSLARLAQERARLDEDVSAMDWAEQAAERWDQAQNTKED